MSGGHAICASGEAAVQRWGCWGLWVGVNTQGCPQVMAGITRKLWGIGRSQRTASNMWEQKGRRAVPPLPVSAWGN